MDKEVILSLKNVSLSYKQRQGLFKPAKKFFALKDISFDIYKGETLGIIGRNGAGKSTLLKIIAGILKPDSGLVLNKGVSVSLLALQAGFDIELSGRDNAILGGMFLGYSRIQAEARLDEIVEFSELGDFIDQPIKTYSAGMRSRLGFSLAMHLSPDVLLLDEVLSVGDKGFREKAEKEMMKKIHSEQTVVLVSHSESQVNRLCERCVTL